MSATPQTSIIMTSTSQAARETMNPSIAEFINSSIKSLESTTVTQNGGAGGGAGASANSDGPGMVNSTSVIAILIVIYSFIFLLGVVGNSLVVYVVCRKRSMQSVTNVFIMNLALSDILMCLLAVPFTPISFFLEYWILGKFLCHLVPFSLGVSVYVSTLTSLAIAIDRYFVIVHPFKPRMRLGVCILLIAVVWVVSISISLPLAIYMEYSVDASNGRAKCGELWPIPTSKRFFDLASLVLQYLIPFIVISYSYTKVWIILSNRTRPGKTKEKEIIELRRKKRTNYMLVAMVAIFAVCWMPLNIVHLTMEFNTEFTKQHYFSFVFFIAHVIAMSSTIYNPFLYAWLNDNFRKEFRQIIPCIFTAIKRCRKSTDANNDEIDNEDGAPERSKFLTRSVSISNPNGGGHIGCVELCSRRDSDSIDDGIRMNELSHHHHNNNNNVNTSQPSKRANASVHAKNDDVPAHEANEAADQKSKQQVATAAAVVVVVNSSNQAGQETQESSVKA